MAQNDFFILRVLGGMFSCLVLTSTKMKIRFISAILFQKSYVVSNGKPTEFAKVADKVSESGKMIKLCMKFRGNFYQTEGNFT